MARTKQRASMPLYGTPGSKCAPANHIPAINCFIDIRPANADAELLMAAAAQMAAQEAAQRATLELRADSKYFTASCTLSAIVVLCEACPILLLLD